MKVNIPNDEETHRQAEEDLGAILEAEADELVTCISCGKKDNVTLMTPTGDGDYLCEDCKEKGV